MRIGVAVVRVAWVGPEDGIEAALLVSTVAGVEVRRIRLGRAQRGMQFE